MKTEGIFFTNHDNDRKRFPLGTMIAMVIDFMPNLIINPFIKS